MITKEQQQAADRYQELSSRIISSLRELNILMTSPDFISISREMDTNPDLEQLAGSVYFDCHSYIEDLQNISLHINN